MQRRLNGSDEGGKGAGLGDPGGPGTCGSAFGTCVLVQLSLLLAACWVALLTGRGGSCASGAAGRKVTPLGGWHWVSGVPCGTREGCYHGQQHP